MIIGLFILTILDCSDSGQGPKSLETSVDIKMVQLHQFMLQEIADDNYCNRFPGTSGFDQSARYVADWLKFAASRLPTDPTAIDGSSDYGSFADRNIPVGGVYSGSAEIKTEEQAYKYGGTVGEPCDPNYNTPNDTAANLDYTIELAIE